jgi:outer membrane protein insertion porin family
VRWNRHRTNPFTELPSCASLPPTSLRFLETHLAKARQLLFLHAAALAVGASGCAGVCSCPWEPTSAAVAGTERASGLATAAKPVESKTVETEPIVRGQSPGYAADPLPGGYYRAPQPVSGGAPPAPYANAYGAPQAPPAATYGQPYTQPAYAGQPVTPQTAFQPPTGQPLPSPTDTMSGISGGISPITPSYPQFQPPTNLPPEINATPTPLDVYVEETRTGQLMFGVTVNSNAGLVGTVVISERNFDIMNPGTSWDDYAVGRAWRGGGQGFRLEAQPGTVLQRYLVSFTDPYFLSTNVSFDASGFYFNRAYFDWTEARVGGRLGWGYRLTPDLSIATSIRLEDVNVFNPRVNGVQELDEVLGHNDIYSGKVTLNHDTRDIPFAPTQGHLITASFEQAFGEFSFPRGEFELAQYLLVRQRPDGSGRHTAGFISKVGVSGSDTPIFENYFAGGFSTIRGFQFRGASPKEGGVVVGGRFQWINSAEYYFPLTADDMIRGTVFCDFGTVETNVALHPDQFRVAPGFGFRINVPAMGPAPLAFDFAFPVAQADTDQKQVFSFFFGASR